MSQRIEDEPNPNKTSTPNALATTIPNVPHSIFDKRQKGLVVLIASTAATCVY